MIEIKKNISYSFMLWVSITTSICIYYVGSLFQLTLGFNLMTIYMVLGIWLVLKQMFKESKRWRR